MATRTGKPRRRIPWGRIASWLVGVPLVLDNFAPSFVYIAFILGLVPISILFGDVFRAVNPWFAIGKAFAWVMRLTARSELPPPLPFPDRLGHLPAAAGLVAFAWLELIAKGGQVPRTVAIATLVYTAVTFIGMAAFGVRPWIDRGESFSVYFGLFARLSPFAVAGNQSHALSLREAPWGTLVECSVDRAS